MGEAELGAGLENFLDDAIQHRAIDNDLGTFQNALSVVVPVLGRVGLSHRRTPLTRAA